MLSISQAFLLDLLPGILHPLKVLWRERNHLFWPIWIATTAVGISLVILVLPKRKSRQANSNPSPRYKWSRRAILAAIFLAVFLACYIAGSLVWEDFTYSDNSYFTNGTLVGKNIPLQLLPRDGRFFPLGHQEYNLIRHFTSSVIGYHSLRIVQLVLLCGILLVFDEKLSVWARTTLIILALITPSILISFSGLIYPEWNVIFSLVCLSWSVKRFEDTKHAAWAVAAVISAQVMLYYKETAFLVLLGFSIGHLLLRCRTADQVGWDFRRLRDPESRLDIGLAFLGVLFVLYYLAAMFPSYSVSYAEKAQLPLKQVFVSYLKLDGLAWLLAVVVTVRIVQILRRKLLPEPLWDGLALGGVSCLVGYLILRMNAGYFLAPADIIAVLYLGHLVARSAKDMRAVHKVCVLALLVLVVLQDLSLSAFRMYERKNVIHAKAEMGQAIKRFYQSDPQSVKRLFFPFAQPFRIMEFVSYVNYLGVPVEQAPSGSSPDRSVVIVGRVFEMEDRCGYRAFLCHPGSRPEPGDLVVVLPDDFTQTGELNGYQKETEPLFSYHPRPSIPQWLLPYVRGLHVVSPAFSQSQLPDSWLNASVTRSK